MNRLILGAALVLGALCLDNAHAQQTAAEVYQWKDANGVTHYSQTPPAKGSYQQRVITHTGAAAPASGATTVAMVENPQCATARANITLLQSQSAAQQDTDGDGKPDKTLNDAERASQLELAQAAAKAYCTP